MYANVFFGVGVGRPRTDTWRAEPARARSASSTWTIEARGRPRERRRASLGALPRTRAPCTASWCTRTKASCAAAATTGGPRCGASTRSWLPPTATTKKDARRPAAAFVQPAAPVCLARALGAIPETNALAYDGVRGVLVAAAGDGVCYGWDVREARGAPAVCLRGHARRRAAALRGGRARRRRERNGGDRLGGRDRAHLGRATGGGVACREPVRRDECLSRCLSRCLSVSGDRGVRVSD